MGDARPFNTALIVLEPESVAVWASTNGLGDRKYDQLTAEPTLIAAVQAGIDKGNTSLDGTYR